MLISRELPLASIFWSQGFLEGFTINAHLSQDTRSHETLIWLWKYLKSMGQNDSLALKQLNQELALIMALVEASRVSELQALDLRYHLYHSKGVLFQLPTLGKREFWEPHLRRSCLEHFRRILACVLWQYEKTTAQYREWNIAALGLCSCLTLNHMVL